MYYIEKADKLSWLDKFLKIIKIEENRIILPIGDCKENEKIDEKQYIKLANKTHKLLEKVKSNKLVISKEIQKNSDYINALYSYGYDIVDGKWLFEAILNNILEYIVKEKKIQKEEMPIAVMVNNLTDYTLKNILSIAGEYKSLTIVTNHINKLQKVEEKIYEELGLRIIVSNNKKKSLSKTKIIINIDFPEELINKYNIFDEAIIINVCGNIKINRKRFNGIIINDYDVKFDNIDNISNYQKYFSKELYEAQFYKNIPFDSLKERIKKEHLEITGLYGLNGKIL